MERETEDRKGEREGSWGKVQKRRLARVEVLDLEKKNTSSSEEGIEGKKIIVMRKGSIKKRPLPFATAYARLSLLLSRKQKQG